MPGHRRVRLQQSGEVGVAGRGPGGAPPDPMLRERRQQGGMRGLHSAGVERARTHQIGARGGPRGDHEDPGPRLRQEGRGVHLQGPKAVALRRERRAERREIAPAVRGEQAADVFDDDGARAAILCGEALDQAPEPEEGRRSPADQAGPRAGQAEILTWAGGPGEVRPARQVGRRQRPDIALVKMPGGNL